MALTTEALQKRTADMEHGLDANRLTPEMLAYQMPVLGNVVSLAQMQEALLPVVEEDSQNHFGADAFTDFDSGSIKDTSASYFGGMSAEDEEEEEKKRMEDIADGIERAFEASGVVDMGGMEMSLEDARNSARYIRENRAAYMAYLRENRPDLYAARMADPAKYEELDRRMSEVKTVKEAQKIADENPEYAEMIAVAQNARTMNQDLNKSEELNGTLRSRFAMAADERPVMAEANVNESVSVRPVAAAQFNPFG